MRAPIRVKIDIGLTTVAFDDVCHVGYEQAKFAFWPEHLGWALWQANRRWQEDFVDEMQRAGHLWFTSARAALLGHIGRKGIRQSTLVARCGTTKQAVQQQLDGLEKEGVLARLTDEADGRSRIVVHTQKGRDALRDGNAIKRMLDDRYRRELGADRFGLLLNALAHIARSA